MDKVKVLGFDITPYAAISILILFGATVLRFWNLGGTSLWYDEAVYILNSQADLGQVIENTRYKNSSPVFLPVLLWLLNSLGLGGEFAMRLPSVLAGIGSVLVLLCLPRVGVRKEVALTAAALLALGQMQVLYAQEVREYSFSILVAALALWAYFAALNTKTLRPLVLVALVTPWIAYSACFAVLAVLVALGGLKLFQKTEISWGALGAAFASFVVSIVLAYALFAQHQLYTADVPYFAEHYLGQSGMNPVIWLIVNTGGILLASLPGLPSVLIVPGLLLIWAAPFALKPLSSLDKPALVALGVLIGGLIMAGILGIYPYGSPRHSVFVAPFLCLLAGEAICDLVGSLGRDLQRIVGGLIAALIAASASIAFLELPLFNGLHPALDKAGDVSVYGEFEDNRALYAWARVQADQGLALYGSAGARPSQPFYGSELTLDFAPFETIGAPDVFAEKILERLEDESIAIIVSAFGAGEVEGIVAALEKRGANVSVEISRPRAAGLLVSR